MFGNTLQKTVKNGAIILGSLVMLWGCNSSDKPRAEIDNKQLNKSTNQILMDGSPWATTALYLVVDGTTDKSTNYIDDSDISRGTISSAQYSNGLFMFIGMKDYKTGAFDQTALITAISKAANEGASPSGFAYGDYAMVRDGEGSNIRRISNASFAPDAIINRTVTVANDSEFGYVFTAANGNSYYVEHKPYSQAFSNMNYPEQLQKEVDGFFTAKNTLVKQIDYNLRMGSPWATTAIYLQVNGQPDSSINYIDDALISSGTISSAQYRDGKFLFVGMTDYTTGEFDESSLITSLDTTATYGDAPQGYSFGEYQILLDEQENAFRRMTNASFAPTAVIDRVVTEASAEKFTYTFSKNGETYYVEHQNYLTAFPTQTYSTSLQTAVDNFFTVH